MEPTKADISKQIRLRKQIQNSTGIIKMHSQSTEKKTELYAHWHAIPTQHYLSKHHKTQVGPVLMLDHISTLLLVGS